MWPEVDMAMGEVSERCNVLALKPEKGSHEPSNESRLYPGYINGPNESEMFPIHSCFGSLVLFWEIWVIFGGGTWPGGVGDH